MLISRLKVPPFIGTLGMYGVARGAGYPGRRRHHRAGQQPESCSSLGNGSILGVPAPVIVALVVVLVLHYVLSQTRFGQYTYADRRQPHRRRARGHRRRAAIPCGSTCSPPLARASAAWSIPPASRPARRRRASRCCSIRSPRSSSAAPSLFGGSGTIVGTVIGALIIAVIQYGLVFINVEPFWQFIAVGVVIILSVLVDQSQARLDRGGRVEE